MGGRGGREEPAGAPALFEGESGAYRAEVFLHLLEREVRRALRYQEFLVVLALDLASPRPAALGPPTLLRRLAEHLQGEVRTTDLVGRWGDGLGVALLCASAEDARIVARRLLARVQGVAQSEALGPPGGAAVRIGGACFPQSGSDARSLLQASLAAARRAAAMPGGDVWFGA
jgi:GGDEF domain-containing protein